MQWHEDVIRLKRENICYIHENVIPPSSSKTSSFARACTHNLMRFTRDESAAGEPHDAMNKCWLSGVSAKIPQRNENSLQLASALSTQEEGHGTCLCVALSPTHNMNVH